MDMNARPFSVAWKMVRDYSPNGVYLTYFCIHTPSTETHHVQNVPIHHFRMCDNNTQNIHNYVFTVFVDKL